MFELLNRYWKIIASKAETACKMPDDVSKTENGTTIIEAGRLNDIDICSFLAKERASNETATPRLGGAVRLAHTGGRDLPSATTWEFRGAISF